LLLNCYKARISAASLAGMHERGWPRRPLLGCVELPLACPLYVIQVKRVYNLPMTVFRYGREHYEEGEFVRRNDATPGDGLDPVVRIVEDLGTIEIPCGKVDCRANCLEYLVRSARKREDYALAECKISPLVSII
jgi:hypothetical protein